LDFEAGANVTLEVSVNAL